MENNLTEDEKIQLAEIIKQIEEGEMSQVKELHLMCNNKYQFAKTHSVYIKDWEKTKKQMDHNLNNGILPPDTSANFYRAMIEAIDKIINKKLTMTKWLFESKFGESIYNFLGEDGKTKSIFNIF